MKDEFGAGDKLHPTAASKLNLDLVQAIIEGDRDGMDQAILKQPSIPETEMISNRILARKFLAEEKDYLVSLQSSLTETKGKSEAIRQVREYLRALKHNFADTFVANEGDSAHEKLSDDRLFREALQQPGEEGIEIARHILDIDVSTLSSADSVLRWMEHTRNHITDSLWGTVKDMREGSADKNELLAAVSKEIELLDRYIMKTLQRL